MIEPHFVVGLLLFDEYETLDLHGPLEFLGVPPTQVSTDAASRY